VFRRNRHGRSIKLGTLALEGVRPVVEGRLFTKAGRVSMRGLWGEKPVKIFECASSGHAGFVGRMMMEAPCARFFPDVYAVHERLVICEWVRGRQISPRTIVIDTACRAQLEELVASLRGAAPPTESGFDYVEDFVLPRFRRCCVGLGLREFQARIETHWDVMRDRAEGKCVSHPDLSPANMIMTAEGQMKIVDNELLGMSRAPWFDELNMAFALGGEGIRGIPLRFEDVGYLYVHRHNF